MQLTYIPPDHCTVCHESLERSEAVTCETCFQRPDGSILSVHRACATMADGIGECNLCKPGTAQK